MIYFTLNSGMKLPCIGFGPGVLHPISYRNFLPYEGHNSWIEKLYKKYKRHQAKINYIDAVTSAVKNGYTLIDYASAYQREDLIKEGINRAGIHPSSLIMTERIDNAAQISHHVRDSFLMSLEKLGLPKVNLLMFHFPITNKFIDTYKEMIRLKEDGFCDVLGVANCNIHHLEKIIKETGDIPEINQIEVHPLFTQKPLLSYCQKKGIVVEAYTPLARMDDRLFRIPSLIKIAERHHKKMTQIILRWHIQNGVIPIFRSMSSSRQIENMDIFDFELSPKEMEIIDSFNINSRLRFDPDNYDIYL